MNSRLLIIAGYFAVTFLCLSVASADEGNGKHDNQDNDVLLKPLEGVWILDSVEMRGEKRQGEKLPVRFRGMTQTIKGDKMIVSRVDGMRFECRLVVRGESEPFELDIIQTDRDGTPRTSKCIFKIVDQKLMLAEGKDERPTSFVTGPEVSTKVSSFTPKR